MLKGIGEAAHGKVREATHERSEKRRTRRKNSRIQELEQTEISIMDTPASMRRITRSQSAALSKKSKMREEVEARRQPLFDITNDSPIISLTTKETPTNRNVSSIKAGVTDKRTPLSGESLLRRQVQTLLQKVEEKKDSSFVTTADKVVLFSSEKEDQLNRALLFDTPDNSKLTDIGLIDSSSLASVDTPDKSEITDIGLTNSSSLAHQAQDPVSPSDDDCSSVWSLQVNDCSEKEELEEEIKREFEEGEEIGFYPDHEEDNEEEEFLYDLCKRVNEMGIGEEAERWKSANLPEFRGRHTKFVYNSEDEIEDQVLVLRGLPAPEGTHVRFSYEDDE
ncbi:hypothetical protein FCM35_KLT19992 [Carex littledalei]|uniref:Uncharacterized protein n=1 Tax=Carex littledalei TaxID=544730 RepID=A0A833QYR3_9POAL|nr:hypothetical protein FCM35_KLT19992 [Carex littledalei]